MNETEGQQRPRLGRTTAVAVGFLGLGLALAASIVSARGLSDPVSLPGWAITFQPPKGWAERAAGGGRSVEALGFAEAQHSGGGRQLFFARVPNPRGRRAQDFCRPVAERLLGTTLWPIRGSLQAASLGPLPGAALGLAPGTYVQAALYQAAPGSSEAYVMILVSPTPLDDAALGLAKTLAGAVRWAER